MTESGNRYYTDARARAATLAATITDGTTAQYLRACFGGIESATSR